MQPTLDTVLAFLARAQDNGAVLRLTDNRPGRLQFDTLVDTLAVVRVDGPDGPFWLNWRDAWWIEDEDGRGSHVHKIVKWRQADVFEAELRDEHGVALHIEWIAPDTDPEWWARYQAWRDRLAQVAPDALAALREQADAEAVTLAQEWAS